MKLLKTFLILLISISIQAQVQNKGAAQPYSFQPAFQIDLVTYKSELENKSRVDVFVKVPYDNLQFVKKGEQFESRYNVTISFYDEENENKILERLWREKVIARNFEETQSKINFNLSYKSFDLAPGKYNLRCEVKDRDSRKNFVANAIANIKSYNDSVNISDPVFIAKKVTMEDGRERIIPNVSKFITSKDSSVEFFFEIYTDKSRKVNLEYLVQDSNEELVYSNTVHRNIDSGTTRINYQIKDVKFTLGNYQLHIRLKNRYGQDLDRTTKKFESKIYGFPESIKDLQLAIDQLVYIATGDELDKIEEAEHYENKLEEYIKFWKEKDPSPATEENEVFLEYYRRITFANEQFGNYIDGWRSDRGMIYIVLGPPDNVERHPYEINSKPYEIWDYYDINKRFIFVDETGFGDYRLLNYQYGDWYRYRYRH